jgi:hypothetical protein
MVRTGGLLIFFSSMPYFTEILCERPENDQHQ